jgi:hypothetical protein
MAQDEIKQKGSPKNSKPGAGGAATKDVPVFGIVKDNVDPTRSGRIKVYLADSPQAAAESDNSDNWVTVSYMSTFFGKVIPDAADDGYGDYKANPSSYGEWHAPPDIGTKVICLFINGDPNYGFYIGCVPEAESLYMVPAIGASDNIIANGGEAEGYGGALRLPVTNINTNNKEMADSPEFVDSPRPVHSYSASIMNQQGIIRDPIRGPISSSAQREAASRVGWGVSTPGRPIYEGGFDDASIASNLDNSKAEQLRVVARRGGHSLVMDDGDIIGRDQLIRIRTALGHQILMSDDGQTLMILHSNGQSYIELGKEGTVDIYSTNSINMRTQGDLNLHADNNVNIHAMENVNIQAKNFHVNAEEEIKLRATKDIKASALSNFTVKAGSAVALASGGDSSIKAGGQAYVNGSKVNLNSGSASTQPEDVDTIPLIAQPDTLYDETKGFMAAPGKLLSIASRAPAHAPWSAAGQGVDVKTDLNASSQLPAQPSPAVAATNNAAANTGPTPVSVATAATAPSSPSVSSAMDKGTTNAVMGAVATNAATGAASTAVTQGASVVKNAAGQATAAVGAFAQTATQLASAGVVKPGADKLINAMVQTGANVAQSMPAAVFTGSAGAENLTKFVQNTTAQAGALVSNLQQAQTAMGAVGALTGKESPQQVAGMVMSAATTGIANTVGAVKAIAGAAGNLPSLPSNAQDALKAIGQGAAAAGVAQTVGGALGGIAGALDAMKTSPGLSGLIDSAKGVAGSAFSAIKNSFKALEAGVPQNLTSIAKTKAAENATVAGQSSQLTKALGDVAAGALVGTATKALGLGGGAVSGALNALSGGTTALGSVSNITGAINNTVAGVTNAVNSVTNSIGNAFNAQKSIATTVGSITGATSSVSTASLTQNLTNAVQTAVDGVNAVAGASSMLKTGDLTNLSKAASVIQQGAAAATSAALASGISNLPGGLKTVSAVVNNATDAINKLPGADSISGLVKEAQAAALNGLPLPKIPDVAGALTSLASAGLPAGAAAELQSAIAGLSSGTGGAIKLPTIGFNTTDRASITAQINSVLGDPKIPIPNLVGEIAESVKDEVQEIIKSGKDLFATIDELDGLNDAIDKAKEAFYAAESELPEGDPEIDNLRKAWFDLLDSPERKTLLSKLDEIKGVNVPAIASAAGGAAAAAGDAISALNNTLSGKSSIGSLIDTASSSASSLLGSVQSTVGSLKGSLSSITTTASSLTNLAGAATQIAGTAKTALGSVPGQGSSAVTSLLNSKSVAPNDAEINNSISGIIGSLPPGPGQG